MRLDTLVSVTTVLVLNGPNLSRLGSREPDVYGSGTLEDLRARLEAEASPPRTVTTSRGDAVEAAVVGPGLTIDLRQTDDEATLIGWLHEAVDRGSPVILNPAAFTHYSYALSDAAKLVTAAGLILVEVHLSNPHAREQFRHTSVISSVATGVIAGFGFDSYSLALNFINTSLVRSRLG